VDQITDFLSDLPIGLIIFIIAMAFGLFGRGDRQQQAAPPPRQQARRPEVPTPPSVFASDDRRAREERALRERQQQGEVITFGGMDFGRPGSLFEEGDDDDDDRDSQWGKTKYGFDESEWGSSFGDRKNPDPIIR
jgi:hypothetical protein